MKKLTYHLLPMIILTLISGGLYLLWRLHSPLSSTLNWDIWEHQAVVNAIKNGSFALLPSALSDTFGFNGYTTAFHFVVALLQKLTATQDILKFWWIAESIFFTLTTIVAYTLSYVVTKNKIASLIAGILSACLFESSVAYTTLFLLPQTVSALLWVIGLIGISLTNNTRTRLLWALGTSLVIIPFHAIVGSFGAMLLFLYAVGFSNSFVGLLLGYLIPTLIAKIYPVGTINSGEAMSFMQSIPDKLTLLAQWYSFLPVPFLILGIWETTHSANSTKKNLMFLLSITIGVVLSSFPYVLKFTALMHYLMIAVMAVGLTGITSRLYTFTAKIITIVITLLVGIAIFFSNISLWQEPILFHGAASQVSPDELDAAKMIKMNESGKNTFLVSDPATQYIMEALSGINSPGGAYMDKENRTFLISALEAQDASTFTHDIGEIQDKLVPTTDNPKLLVVSGRTFQWLALPKEKREDISFNIWRPEALSLSDLIIIETWKDRFALGEVYRNASVVVLKYPSYDTK